MGAAKCSNCVVMYLLTNVMFSIVKYEMKGNNIPRFKGFVKNIMLSKYF